MTEEAYARGREELIKRQFAVEGLQQIPAGEPTLAQLDEWQREVLIRLCNDTRPILYKDEEGEVRAVRDESGELVYEAIFKYPDIMALITSIGHLEGTSNYTWEQAQWMYLDWEALEWDPIADRYEREPMAMTILHGIKGIKRRQIFGDSQGGSRQNFVVKVGGSERALRMFTGEEKKKRRGLFGLW